MSQQATARPAPYSPPGREKGWGEQWWDVPERKMVNFASPELNRTGIRNQANGAIGVTPETRPSQFVIRSATTTFRRQCGGRFLGFCRDHMLEFSLGAQAGSEDADCCHFHPQTSRWGPMGEVGNPTIDRRSLNPDVCHTHIHNPAA